MKKYRLLKASPPSHGPWYWLYLKPDWVLRAFDVPVGDDSLDHGDLWEHSCALEVLKHYKIASRSEEAKALINAPYGFPRGRCVHIDSKESMRGINKFELAWGQDLPKSLSLEKERRKLIGAFHLTSILLQDNARVKFVRDNHEQMLSEDQKILQSVVGKIPY